MVDRARGPSPGPRVLRVGVLRGRTVLAERLLRPGEGLSIGTSPRADLRVEGPGLPRRHALFVAARGGWRLGWTEGMQGQISSQGRSVELEARAGGPLAPDARGRVQLGDLTVLFQQVAAPPGLAAVDFRPRLLDDEDPVFLGFLGLFSAVAGALMAYVFSTEPVELVTAGQIPDRFAEVFLAPSVPADPAPPPETIEVEHGTVVRRETVEPEAQVVQREPASPAEAAAAAAAAAVARREEVIEQSRLLAALIGTPGETSSDMRIQDLLSDKDLRLGSVREALKGVGGVAVATEEALGASRQGTDRGAREDRGIGDLRRGTTGEGRGVEAGPAVAARGRLMVEGFDSPAEGGDEAARTFKRNRGQIQACYERSLVLAPALRGRLALTVDVIGGRVTSVHVDGNAAQDEALADCVTRRVREWRFDPAVSGELYSVFVLEPGG